MTYLPSQQAYAQSVGTTPTRNHVYVNRAPTVNDVVYPIGIFWNNTSNQTLWYLASQSSPGGNLQSNWIEITEGSMAIETLTPDSGGAVSPISNNINIHGINGIVTSNTGSATLTISGSGIGLLQNASATLTSAQIKNLASVSQTVIPAQGSDTLIVPYAVTNQFIYGGTNAFTNVGDLAFGYFDGSSFYQISNTSFGGFLDGTTNAFLPYSNTPFSVYTTAQCVNLPVVIYNKSSNITGNAANNNQLIIQMQYVTLTT